MENKNEKLKFFELIAEKYIDLHLSKVDFPKMQNDEDYSKKIFFYKWAFERNNAPHGYKVAAIKSLTKIPKNSDPNKYKEIFNLYYEGSKNEKNNPFYDHRINDLNIQQCIENINNKEFSKAFDNIALNGISHKIRSFFIRDMVYLLKLEKKGGQLPTEDYLYMFPTDIWVEKTGEFLNFKEIDCKKIKCNKYKLNPKSRLKTAASIINACKET